MKAQRQDSLTDQMNDLVKLAIEHGMYDAVDWIRKRWELLGPSTAIASLQTPIKTGQHHEDSD